ncbi:unnamed protein product [Prunus armeniaca]|uniref:Uncharacterized protein n=1 Tax=Prunus armeniaca TaxID=36596 RepID=A0A6J5XRE9_PRUAR|nr:unnamed protein product [Prunus armeniaca]
MELKWVVGIWCRLFKHSVEELDLRGESSVDAEWIAYIGAFRYLRSLNLSDCRRLTTSALWPIAGISILITVGYIEETQRKRKAPEEVGNGENGGGVEEDQQRQKRIAGLGGRWEGAGVLGLWGLGWRVVVGWVWVKSGCGMGLGVGARGWWP